ncbi:MAG: hypothetical protein ACOCWQ_03475 [Nanoarchaeota archaeon]
MAKRDTSQSRWKKKKWYEVVAPKTFNSVSLGEALAEEKESLVGRKVQMNMMNVVRNPKMQSITMRFRITSVNEKTATTESFSYTMAHSALKRLVRSRRDRIDDSFVVKTKDDKNLRVKPLIITLNNNSESQRRGIRQLVRREIVRFCAERSFEDFVSEVVGFRVQRDLKKKLAKVTPVRNFEIRAFELVEGKLAQEPLKIDGTEVQPEPTEEEASEESEDVQDSESEDSTQDSEDTPEEDDSEESSEDESEEKKE